MQELELSASQARELTDRIRVGVEAIWELVKQAYQSRAWAVLGYDSWDDYCTREFGTSRIKLPREERQEVVSSMREIGMSTRAIGTAIGASEATVRRELASASNDAVGPAEITGVNGKTYTPKPRPEPVTPEWEDVGTIPQSRLKDIARPTATAIPQSELDELNEVEEVRPVFQAPGEPDPGPEPARQHPAMPKPEYTPEQLAAKRQREANERSARYIENFAIAYATVYQVLQNENLDDILQLVTPNIRNWFTDAEKEMTWPTPM